jgi:hypothetical protein
MAADRPDHAKRPAASKYSGLLDRGYFIIGMNAAKAATPWSLIAPTFIGGPVNVTPRDPLGDAGLVPKPTRQPKRGHKRCNGTGIIGYLEGHRSMPLFCSCVQEKKQDKPAEPVTQTKSEVHNQPPNG